MRALTDFISQRALGVDASGIRKVFDLAAQLPDPINLSIGQPDFGVPQEVQAAGMGGINGRVQIQGVVMPKMAVGGPPIAPLNLGPDMTEYQGFAIEDERTYGAYGHSGVLSYRAQRRALCRVEHRRT
jgi:hypothetical protein